MIDETFLTTDEVLGYLQVNLRTVYRLIKAGKMPAVRVGTPVAVPQERSRHLAGKPARADFWPGPGSSLNVSKDRNPDHSAQNSSRR